MTSRKFLKAKKMDKSRLSSEKVPQQAVINKILVASTIAASLAYASAQIRALSLGWTSRDIFQFLAVIASIILSIIRQKLKIHHKIIFSIIPFSIGSVAGIYTLGLLVGDFNFSHSCGTNGNFLYDTINKDSHHSIFVVFWRSCIHVLL